MSARVRIKKPAPVLQPAPPVTGRNDQNAQWLDVLAPRTSDRRDHKGRRRRQGVNPRNLPAKTLADAGHPPRSATACIRLYLADMHLDSGRTKASHEMVAFMRAERAKNKGLKAVRRLCLACAEDVSDVKYCAIIACPLWAHRLGKSPHNRRKHH